MRKFIALGAIVIAIPLAACGSAPEADDATASEATTTSTPAVVTDTAAAVDEGTEAPVDKNQQIADQYAKIAPGALSKLCSNLPTVGNSWAVDEIAKQLGTQVIRQGGSPTEVAQLLLDKC